jgi:serine/threonine-protein kinase RsbW
MFDHGAARIERSPTHGDWLRRMAGWERDFPYRYPCDHAPPLAERQTGDRSGMTSPHGERRLEQTLPSALDAYHGFIEAVLQHLDDLGWDDGERFGVHMALEESISNAIRHGNKQDPAKQVEIECRFSGERFWARICDEGAGFRPCDVPDCCAPDRLEIPGGRGLALMNAYMTHVQYNDRGNCVTLEKLRGAAPPRAAEE